MQRDRDQLRMTHEQPGVICICFGVLSLGILTHRVADRPDRLEQSRCDVWC